MESKNTNIPWRPTLVNLVGLLVGSPRDSSGRKNNTFFLFILSFFVLSAVLIGSVFYRTARYRIELYCPPIETVKRSETLPVLAVRRKVKTGSAASLSNVSSHPKKAELYFACGKTQITINATLQSPAPLPSAFYWVSFLMFLFLGTMYSIIRHPVTQGWLIDMLYAWKGVSRENPIAALERASEIGLDRPPPPKQEDDQR